MSAEGTTLDSLPGDNRQHLSSPHCSVISSFATNKWKVELGSSEPGRKLAQATNSTTRVLHAVQGGNKLQLCASDNTHRRPRYPGLPAGYVQWH